MPAIQLQVSEEVLFSLKETPESLGNSMKLLAAAKLVELGRLSTGRAADLAGMTRVEFLLRLRDMHVSPADLTADQITADAARI